jgi:hypothetical protein
LGLSVAGAEFADIRKFGLAQGWNVSDRQIRRYQQHADREMAKTAGRDRTQLLGRHLLQRRALFAQAWKKQDLGTALQIGRDEAQLLGLYPSSNGSNKAQAAQNAPAPRPIEGSPLTRRQRTVRRVTAEATGDQVGRRLVRETARHYQYDLDETDLPYQMLQTLALMYANEQLERAAMFLHAVWRMSAEDENGDWDLIGAVSAYLFRIGQQGWTQFTQELGIDGDAQVRANHQGELLELCGGNLCHLPITAEQLEAAFKARGFESSGLVTADDLARSWEQLFREVCEDR